MEKYFISSVRSVVSTTNRKYIELEKIICKYKDSLLEMESDRLYESVKEQVNELNRKYPRSEDMVTTLLRCSNIHKILVHEGASSMPLASILMVKVRNVLNSEEKL